MGDVGQVMPTIHPYVSGAVGSGHGIDYLIEDWDNAVLNAAKAMALTVVDLLADGATSANEIKASHKANMTIAEYLEVQVNSLREETYSVR